MPVDEVGDKRAAGHHLPALRANALQHPCIIREPMPRPRKVAGTSVWVNIITPSASRYSATAMPPSRFSSKRWSAKLCGHDPWAESCPPHIVIGEGGGHG